MLETNYQYTVIAEEKTFLGLSRIFDNVLSVSSTEYELSCVVVPRFIGTKTAYFTSVLALSAIVILFQSIHSLQSSDACIHLSRFLIIALENCEQDTLQIFNEGNLA